MANREAIQEAEAPGRTGRAGGLSVCPLSKSGRAQGAERFTEGGSGDSPEETIQEPDRSWEREEARGLTRRQLPVSRLIFHIKRFLGTSLPNR